MAISMKEDKITSVRIRRSTLDNLQKIGKMGESYNDVIDRMIKKELGV
jgi:hypothetical protein